VGSKTFDGVWFISYSLDHPPPHVHGEYAETEVIVDLLPDGTISRSSRLDAVQPGNAPRSDVRRILAVAAAHAAELKQLWEKTHGTAS
jgi:uncharacterized protein DUF4160